MYYMLALLKSIQTKLNKDSEFKTRKSEIFLSLLPLSQVKFKSV